MLHLHAVLGILERRIPNPGGCLYEVLRGADACATGCEPLHLSEPETDLGCSGSAPPCMTTRCDPSHQCAVTSLHVEGHTHGVADYAQSYRWEEVEGGCNKSSHWKTSKVLHEPLTKDNLDLSGKEIMCPMCSWADRFSKFMTSRALQAHCYVLAGT